MRRSGPLRQGAAAGPSGDPTRLARARAQVDGIVAERLRTRLATPELSAGMAALYAAVAAHELDPYAAADRAMSDLSTADLRPRTDRR